MKFCPSFLHFRRIWLKFASGDCISSTLKDRDFRENRKSEKPNFTYRCFESASSSPVLGKIYNYLHIIHFSYLSFSLNWEGLTLLVAVNANCSNACALKPYDI